jgi:predicted membrane channel-forming protein YqfA (hemolysin III family)
MMVYDTSSIGRKLKSWINILFRFFFLTEFMVLVLLLLGNFENAVYNTILSESILSIACILFLGCVFFLCLGIFYMFRPNISFVAPLQEKVVFGLFFLGAILCLSFSWLFHTVYCHSEGVSRLFSK